MKALIYEPRLTRPDLPIPLSPLGGFSKLVRNYLIGLRRPRFVNAHEVTIIWAGVSCAIALVSIFFSSPWQQVAVTCSAVLGLYVVGRVFALAAFERRQRAFEPEWMVAQSEVLRAHEFDVLRFTVQDPSRVFGGQRTYDLTRPADVGDLLSRQERERESHSSSQARVEFVYLAASGQTVVTDAKRDLPELVFLPGFARLGHAWVRFPEASYLAPGGQRGRSAGRTYWALTGEVLIAVGNPAYGGASGLVSAPEAGSAR